ncbi:MAG: DnaD domain protein [Lachnospiraceae bacterium]|nr:DnaD domain protein [Lachnospiraceae bacterium]
MDNAKDIKFNNIELSAGFLQEHLKSAPAEYIVVYMFAKSTVLNCPIHLTDIVKTLSMPVTEVFDACMYWQEKGLIKIEDGMIVFPEKAQQGESRPLPKMLLEDRPQYQPQELNMYAQKNSDVRQLFDITQKYLGRMLTHSDLSGIFSLYHWLGLSIEVIDKLLSYCAENNHRNMRYIERVAIDWAESGISTAKEAEERIHLYNNEFRRIMRAFGQSGRNPIASEEKFMNKWINNWSMPIELLEIACEKTVLNTGKVSFGYADKIIESWYNAGAKNTDDIARMETEFITKKQEKSEEPKKAVAKNKFTNYQQRQYDYEMFEKLEQENTK